MTSSSARAAASRRNGARERRLVTAAGETIWARTRRAPDEARRDRP